MIPLTIAFYGFKGGVGNSLLAANIGVLHAQRGKTLLWDLDIEAPGMQYIPGLECTEKDRRGFFDWLVRWQESQKSANDADFEALVGLAYQTPASERLFFLPAFGTTKDFVGLFEKVGWNDFLVNNLSDGLNLFRKAIKAFGTAGFDTVIIDTCTGITDIGGLTAALLPHVTVLVGNYGRQNTEGLAHVWRALEPAATGKIKPRTPLPDLVRVLVASPIITDRALRKSGESMWEEIFGIKRSEVITVPFDKNLSLGEELYARKFPDSPVTKAYRELDKRIEGIRKRLNMENNLGHS